MADSDLQPSNENEKHDTFIYALYQQCPNGIHEMLDVIFNFLMRKTTFFTCYSLQEAEQFFVEKVRKQYTLPSVDTPKESTLSYGIKQILQGCIDDETLSDDDIGLPPVTCNEVTIATYGDDNVAMEMVESLSNFSVQGHTPLSVPTGKHLEAVQAVVDGQTVIHNVVVDEGSVVPFSSQNNDQVSRVAVTQQSGTSDTTNEPDAVPATRTSKRKIVMTMKAAEAKNDVNTKKEKNRDWSPGSCKHKRSKSWKVVLKDGENVCAAPKVNRIYSGHIPKPPRQQGNYSARQLQEAYKAVRDKKLSARKASMYYGVPQTTIRDRIKGRVQIDCSHGKPQLIPNEMELKISNHATKMKNLGYGYSRGELAKFSSQYARHVKKLRKNKLLSKTWVNGLIHRQPDLKLGKDRSKSPSKENVDVYFNTLTETLTEHNLTNKPEYLYNVNDKDIILNHEPSTDQSHPPSDVSLSTTTVIACGNAAGYQIPPFFVFTGSGKHITDDLKQGCTTGTGISASESGLSNTCIFQHYIQEHFMKYAMLGRDGQKTVIILDGHKSYLTLSLIEWAENNDIIFMVLPAHCSDILQPLNVSCIQPFLSMYNKNCCKFEKKYGAITQYDLCKLGCPVYVKAMSANNLRSGFRKCGVVPLNRDVMSDSDFEELKSKKLKKGKKNMDSDED